MMKKIRYRAMILLTVSVLTACDGHEQSPKKHDEKVVTARVEQVTQPLYFRGVLQPLKTRAILSPVAGRVATIHFLYGQPIQKGQAVVSIDATTLAQEYQKHVADYLQKKTAYTNSLEEYRGSQALYKAGVISREEFVSSQTQYRTKQLNYVQSQYEMEKLLKKAGLSADRIEQLTLENTQTVNKLLHRAFKQVDIQSSATGIALFPQGSDDKKTLKEGEAVKQGQLLVAVGDLQGLKIKIQVNEVNIDRMHRGMKATIEGSAFPDIQLHGTVTSVSSQAKAAGRSASAAEFPVIVTVPTLSQAQQQKLRVGMSAKVTIDVQNKPVVMVPINAVHRKKDGLSVWLSPRAGAHRRVVVKAGRTTLNKVAIIHGVRAGDRVLVGSSAADHHD